MGGRLSIAYGKPLVVSYAPMEAPDLANHFGSHEVYSSPHLVQVHLQSLLADHVS